MFYNIFIMFICIRIGIQHEHMPHTIAFSLQCLSIDGLLKYSFIYILYFILFIHIWCHCWKICKLMNRAALGHLQASM